MTMRLSTDWRSGDGGFSRVRYEEVLGTLRQLDQRDRYGDNGRVPDCADLRQALETTYGASPGSPMSVLGVDVYRYSQYAELEQALVPLVLRLIYEEAARDCLSQERFVFQEFLETPDERINRRTAGSRLRKDWIDTGDGGFQMLATPLHALLMALNFETDVRTYNSGHFYPKLHQVVGSLSLRYCITTGAVFRFERSFYGPAIIDNARILSRDTLNRCLIDESTFDWFTDKFNGVESLEFSTLDNVKTLPDFSGYSPDYLAKSNVLIPAEWEDGSELPIHLVAAQKIGTIQAKRSSLSIYNLYVQALLVLSENNGTNQSTFVVGLGNLNTSGLPD